MTSEKAAADITGIPACYTLLQFAPSFALAERLVSCTRSDDLQGTRIRVPFDGHVRQYQTVAVKWRFEGRGGLGGKSVNRQGLMYADLK